MLFEELTLRPNSGDVDVPAVTAWLDARPYAFHDPVAGDGWHLSGTPRQMALNRQERIDHPRNFPLGVRVTVSPDRVWLAARADNETLARALEFVQWLARDGRWTAEVDGRKAEPLGAPGRRFPDNLPAPATLDDERTLPPVSEGTLVTWNTERDREPRTFAIHSSGQVRYRADRRTLRGHLLDEARTAWNQAMAAVDADDPALSAEPDPATAVAMEIETPEGLEWVSLDTVVPPAAYQPIVAMISRWMDALDPWSPGTPIRDITNIYEVS
jgi:hypothetical protein